MVYIEYKGRDDSAEGLRVTRVDRNKQEYMQSNSDIHTKQRTFTSLVTFAWLFFR